MRFSQSKSRLRRRFAGIKKRIGQRSDRSHRQHANAYVDKVASSFP